MVTLHTPALLTDDEWAEIERVFHGREWMLAAVRLLKESGNVPQSAKDLFVAPHANVGEERMNNLLREAGLDFRIGRTSPWAHENRPQRKLAVSRWQSKAKKKAPSG